MIIDSIIDTGLKIIDRVLPDQKAKDEAKIKLLELQQQGELQKLTLDVQLAQGQMDINKVEAQSENLFKSGWRPFLGWVCGISFVYDLIVRPLLNGILVKYGLVFPQLDSATLTSLTFGLLGLGAYRTVEKINKK